MECMVSKRTKIQDMKLIIPGKRIHGENIHIHIYMLLITSILIPLQNNF